MQAFETYTKELEASYLMFSISLDEAISLHEDGFLTKSFQVLALSSELCRGLSTSLENMLRSLAEQCSEHDTNPAVAPLNPSDFRNFWSRCLALESSIWHRAPLTRKAQFHNKIRSLRSLVRHARQDFCTAADALAIEGIVVDSSNSWAVMDRAHFDLNTCLRESFILLKCFLQVVRDENVQAFQENVLQENRPTPRQDQSCGPSVGAPGHQKVEPRGSFGNRFFHSFRTSSSCKVSASNFSFSNFSP
jgi:hypothetical protein